MKTILLHGGTLILPDRVKEVADIIIKGKIIEWVGKKNKFPASIKIDEEIDVSDEYLLPGLIDSHTHLSFNGKEDMLVLCKQEHETLLFETVRSAAKTLKSGVTTIRDVGGFNYSDVYLKKAINEGLIEGPDMLVAGKAISITGGHLFPLTYEADGVNEMKKATRLQIKNGADLIKIMVTGGAVTGQNIEVVHFDLEEIKAVVKVAHEHKIKVGAHVHGSSGIKRASRGGVDAIEHGSLLDDESAKIMKDNGVFLVLTRGLEFMFEDICESWLKRISPIRKKTARVIELAQKYDIPIAIGTDAGGNQFAPHGSMPRLMEQLCKEGMSTTQVIKSSTIIPAQLLGVEDSAGTIESGKIANILVLKDNPLSNISTLRNIVNIINKGEII
jgi:imidazolonepropionase-like amidohydrolase